MHIANNIIKHNLQNVLFLVGSACGGKTTMAKAIEKKHGYVYFSEMLSDEARTRWHALIDSKYQPNASGRRAIDWEVFFSRSVEEFLNDKKDNHGTEELIEFAIIELIKLSQTQKVVTDVWIPNWDFLLEISDRSRIACLNAPGEMIVRDYYDREEHQAFTNCIKGLKNPEQKFETQNTLFKLGALEEAEKAKKYNLFTITRSDKSTVEGTLALLEQHFGL